MSPDMVDRAQERPTIGEMIASITRYRELVRNLVLRDLKLKYRGSVLGFVWSLVNPLAMVTVYTIAFTFILRTSMPGFVFFLLLGLLAWSFFANSATMATGAFVDGARPDQERDVSPVDSADRHGAVQSVAVSPHLRRAAAGDAGVYRPPLAASVLAFPALLSLQVVFTVGVALLLAVSTAYFRDTRHLLELALALLFWLTPVVYPLSQVDERFGAVSASARSRRSSSAISEMFFYGRWPATSTWVTAIGYAAVALIAGAWTFLASTNSSPSGSDGTDDRRRGVSRRFALAHNRTSELKQHVINLLQRRASVQVEEFWALRNVSATIEPGRGGGRPRSQWVWQEHVSESRGRSAPADERPAVRPSRRTHRDDDRARGRLSSSAHRTGECPSERLDPRPVASRDRRDVPRVVAYSGLEHFMDVALQTYSSGMQMRLAFAIAANLDPDILLLDEVFAVGDAAFQQQCADTVRERCASGRTVLFVSHSPHAVRALCHRLIVLEHGSLVFDGSVEEGLAFYDELVNRDPAIVESAST